MSIKNNISINYLVSFYLGERRALTSNSNKFYLLEKHIDFLNSIDISDSNIKKATFVFNVQDKNEYLAIFEYFKTKVQMNESAPPIRVIIRNNTGMSYGAWDCGIITCFDSKQDYFFLIEDDYIPSSKDFYIPFLNKISEEVPYICCMMADEPKPHPAISNGLIAEKACRVVFNKYNAVFAYFLDKNYSLYDQAAVTQLNFYDLFIALEFKVEDICLEYSSAFFDYDQNKVIIYGNSKQEPLIVPIETEGVYAK